MSRRPGPRRTTSLVSVLLKRVTALETELAISRAEIESARSLHRRQCDTLVTEAIVRQMAQQRAERELMVKGT